jgi:hypothetical protein
MASLTRAMIEIDDLVWAQVDVLSDSSSKSHKVKCHHCQHEFSCSSVTRIRDHLMKRGGNVKGCSQPPAALVAQIREAEQGWEATAGQKRAAEAAAAAAQQPATKQRTLDSMWDLGGSRSSVSQSSCPSGPCWPLPSPPPHTQHDTVSVSVFQHHRLRLRLRPM